MNLENPMPTAKKANPAAKAPAIIAVLELMPELPSALVVVVSSAFKLLSLDLVLSCTTVVGMTAVDALVSCDIKAVAGDRSGEAPVSVVVICCRFFVEVCWIVIAGVSCCETIVEGC